MTTQEPMVYILFANVEENELLHFYVPNSKLTTNDHKLLLLASDPISDKTAKEAIGALLDLWWEYLREGPQGTNIVQTYCVSHMRP